MAASNSLAFAKLARTEARAMSTHDPLRYAAYRRVSYAERQLSDEEFERYQEWANQDARLATPGRAR